MPVSPMVLRMPEPSTYWNGEPTPARKVTLVVADAPEHELYWARSFIGMRRNAVEVTYNDETFYLDDDAFDEEKDASEEFIRFKQSRMGDLYHPNARNAGDGWWKVTEGRGSPRYAHANLRPEPNSVEPRE
jgi:hypothetical protein